MMNTQPQNHYTFLRIKRKRTEEPLDALVVESRFRRKKSRGGVDVFQFAQTVEHDAWKDTGLRQHLQSQISRLAQDSTESAKAQIPPARETRVLPAPYRTDNGTRRYAAKLADSGEDPRSKRRRTSPPKVVSSKDVPRNDFKMYDAVLEDQGPTLPPMDPEMEKFLPMLQDYLTLQETSANLSAVSSDDYVWDVFYRKPYSLSEWNSFATNVATITGLPGSVEDEELSDDSQTEEEDEADEDSNAEEYYKNDYPDEESTSDDGFFDDHSDDDDLINDPADRDHDWR